MLPSARPTAKRVSSGENASAVTPCGIQSMNLHRCTSRCLLMAREREIESSEQRERCSSDEATSERDRSLRRDAYSRANEKSGVERAEC